jgi:DNA-3-methyladenine glycosylase I
LPAEGNSIQRCAWCGTDGLYIAYHDREWGVPVHDDRRLFEMLVLEGAQAGLSWLTILKKRDHYRRAFDGFEAACVARYGRREISRLLSDAGIVRNRLKIEAAIRNARATLAIKEQFGSLDAFLWRYVGYVPRQRGWRSAAQVPVRTSESDNMSRDLRKRGFSFVGPTICYAFMQAVGMVNDHTLDCFRHVELGGTPDAYPSPAG